MFTLDGGTRLKALEASGIAFDSGPEGSMQARVDRLSIRHVRLQTALAAVAVSKLTLTGAVIRVAASASRPSVDVLGLSAEEIHLEGVDVTMGQPPHPRVAPTVEWRLDPLTGLEGLLQVFIRDAKWIVDAHISVPVVNGCIDFDRVVVEHFGPNSAMGIGRNSIYVDAPNLVRTDLFVFTAPVIPGANYEARGGLGARVTDRGSLDIAKFVEALLAGGGEQPIGRVAGRDVEVMLDRTKLSGELRLQDGAIGTQRHHLTLAGGAQGKNRISLSAAVLGHRLVARMPALSASGAVFELFGRAGTAGMVTATLEGHATGLSATTDAPAGGRGVTVSVHSMTVRQVRLGNVDDTSTPA